MQRGYPEGESEPTALTPDPAGLTARQVWGQFRLQKRKANNMTQKEYNGWTNYETWLVKLWMDNEAGSQDYWLETAADHLKVDGEDARRSLADRLKEEHEDALPEVSGFVSDLLNAALSEVNWWEIAESLLEDARRNVEA